MKERRVYNSVKQHHSFCKSAQLSVVFGFTLDALICVFSSLTHLQNADILYSLHQLIPQALGKL